MFTDALAVYRVVVAIDRMDAEIAVSPIAYSPPMMLPTIPSAAMTMLITPIAVIIPGRRLPIGAGYPSGNTGIGICGGTAASSGSGAIGYSSDMRVGDYHFSSDSPPRCVWHLGG